MKKVELNSVLYYGSQLVEVIGIADGRTIIMEPVIKEKEACPLCNRERDESISVLEHCPAFQKSARPVKTVIGDS